MKGKPRWIYRKFAHFQAGVYIEIPRHINKEFIVLLSLHIQSSSMLMPLSMVGSESHVTVVIDHGLRLA